MSDNVYILGVGMIKFGKYLEKGVKKLTGETLDLVLEDCDLKTDDIEAAWFSTAPGVCMLFSILSAGRWRFPPTA